MYLGHEILSDTFNCVDFAKYLHGYGDAPGHHLNDFFHVGTEIQVEQIKSLLPGTALLIAKKDKATGKIDRPDHVVIHLGGEATISLFGTSGILLICPTNKELYKNFDSDSTWVLTPKNYE